MNAWGGIKAIMKRELGGYFTSPIAYVFLVISADIRCRFCETRFCLTPQII